MTTFAPPADLTTRVELSFSCSHLPNLDVLSKSDPQIVVYAKDTGVDTWSVIGRTEIIQDNLNPRFARPVSIVYRFEELQHIRFDVIDVDAIQGEVVTKFDSIGHLITTLGEVVGNGELTKPLTNPHHSGRNNGTIHIKAVEMAKGLEGYMAKFEMRGVNLVKKDFFGKSDPYIVIERQDPSGSTTPVHKTEVIKNNLNPVWHPFELPVSRLAPTSLDSPIIIRCYDWDAYGSPDFMGEASTTLGKLRKGEKSFQLIEPKKVSKKSYTNSGTIELTYKEYKNPSFLEYIIGGTEISLVVAVDFTGSNGDPRSPTSLHYFSPDGSLNQYGKAIRSVGDVCAPYDHDGNIPVFGFGAALQDGSTSHCFELNRNPANPEVRGIDGVLQVYRDSFSWAALSGPTHFSPVLDR
ncbi:copine-8-like, partial [Planoprotostelium fungivorum]